MVLSPTRRANSGIVQTAVPFAVPDRPPDAVQVTEATPTASEATPVILTLAADVDEIDVLGELMEIEGAVRSFVLPAAVGAAGVVGGVGCCSDVSRRVAYNPRIALMSSACSFSSLR